MVDYPATGGNPQNRKTLNNGDTLEVYNGGSADGTVINTGGRQTVYAGGTSLNALVNGGVESVSGSDSGTIVASGLEIVNAGGSTTGSAVRGGEQDIYGTAAGTAISGGFQYVFGSTDAAALSGGNMVVEANGGTATNTTITGTGYQSVYGTSSTTSISAGGVQEVLAGGATNNTTINGNGSQFVDAGGSSTGTVLNGDVLANGQQFVGGTSTGTTINANAAQLVFASGAAINSVVNAGGGQDVYGNSTGSTINTGGVERVESGGTTTNTTIAGGTLDVLDGASVAGNIDFSGAGTLKIEHSVAATTNYVFTAPILDFGAGDVLDLSGLGFAAGTTSANLSGSTLTVSDGRASETLTLTGASAQSFAVADDGAGGVRVTGVALPPPPPPPKLSVAFDPTTAGFVNGRTPILTGQVANASGNATVEIYNGDPAKGGRDLGAATVTGNTFSFKSNIGAGDTSSLYAVAKDASGASATALAPYELVTGVQGASYKAIEYDFTPDGSYGYTEYDSRGNVLVAAFDNGGNTHTIEGNGQSGQTFFSIANDKIDAYGRSENFVFSAGFGKDVLADFIAGGDGHDTLDLSNTNLSSLVDVLRHTTGGPGGAVIHAGGDDTIKLQGVTKAELKAHPNAFVFG